MVYRIKKLILSNTILTGIAIFLRRIYLKKKLDIIYRKNSFIGFSTICEGKNGFYENCSIVSSFIGYGSYIGANSKISKTKIGRFSSIGPNVRCIFGKHPSHTFVSTHPSFFSLSPPVNLKYGREQLFEEYARPLDISGNYSILIGNDVWIGANVSIMDGITIGDGAIVASNALVNKNVEPYTIVGGVPAKPIKRRFEEKDIEFLLKLKWWEKPLSWISQHSIFFEDMHKLKQRITNGQM